MEKQVRVSLCVIALNEEKYIGDLFENIRNQDYDHKDMEVILVDGGSSDRTKPLMEEFREKETSFARVEVLDNPKKIQPAGWNVAIRASRGELIIRVDAHAKIPSDFVRQNVACIDEGEDVCGGTRTNIIDGSQFGRKVLLMAENSMFGSGIAAYRNSGEKKYVRTVAHACYKREVFDKVGLFNETLLRSEDNEMHHRIRKAGYKICMSDTIRSEYQTRTTLKRMLRQKYGNGKWIGITSAGISPEIFSLYHFVPFLFVLAALACAVLFVLAFIPPLPYWLGVPFLAGVALYLVFDLALTLKSCKDYREWRAVFVLPFLFPLLHFAYGFGTLAGFFSFRTIGKLKGQQKNRKN